MMFMRMLIYLAVFTALFFLYVRYLEKRSLFYPIARVDHTPAEIGFAFEDVAIRTPDGLTLHGWWVPAQNSGATLIFFHGNAGNIGDRLGKIELFHHLGLNILIFDYRGYGQSEGRPSEAGIYKDALGAYDYLRTRRDVDSQRVVFYGASLGGAVAVDLARKRPCAALIVDSSFTNAVDMAKTLYPFAPAFLVQARLDSLGKIGGVAAPKLFIHSRDDEIVPFRLGRKLFEAAPEPKEFLEVAGSHNDGHMESEEIFTNGIEYFLQQYVFSPREGVHGPE